MAKEHVGWYLGLLVVGLFYVYYRHEQATQGGAVPPPSHGGPGPQLDIPGMLGSFLNLVGGGSPSGGGGGAPPIAHANPPMGGGRPGGPGRGGRPDICNHLTCSQILDPQYQQRCGIGPSDPILTRCRMQGRTTSVHPTGPIAGQTMNPQDQWNAMLYAPPAQAHYASEFEGGCPSCGGGGRYEDGGGRYASTWFDQEEPSPYMESMPRHHSFGNVGDFGY